MPTPRVCEKCGHVRRTPFEKGEDQHAAESEHDAAAKLAEYIYYSRSLVYGDSGKLWEALSLDLHRHYIDLAQRLLTELAPNVDRTPPEPAFKPRLVTRS